MSKNPNIVEDGKATRFSKTNQPKGKGRKPSLYAVLKELAKLEGNIDLSRDDFIKLSLLMLSKPISEIKALVMADDTLTRLFEPRRDRKFAGIIMLNIFDGKQEEE